MSFQDELNLEYKWLITRRHALFIKACTSNTSARPPCRWHIRAASRAK